MQVVTTAAGDPQLYQVCRLTGYVTALPAWRRSEADFFNLYSNKSRRSLWCMNQLLNELPFFSIGPHVSIQACVK